MAETKTGAPNIQDVFLNYARREKLAVTLHLLDGREFEARIKNFDRFALIVEHNGMDHLIFKHAIATIRTPRSVPELLLVASSLSGVFRRAIVIVLDSVGAGELPDAALYGDQGSNTLGNIADAQPCSIPTLAALGLGCAVALPGVPVSGRAAGGVRPDGRAIGGQGLGDRPLGADGDRARSRVPDVPARLSAGADRRVRVAHRPPGARQRRRLGHRHHRRARRRAHAHGPAHCLHVGRQRVPDCRARGRRAGRSSTSGAEIAYEIAVEGAGLGRVIARPFVGAPGSFRRTANRHDYAMPPQRRDAARSADRARSSRHGDRQDQRPVRGPRHRRSASRPRATTTAWTSLADRLATIRIAG